MGFFKIKNHELIEKYVALILSKGLMMYSEKRLLLWFPKKKLKSKDLSFSFCSIQYNNRPAWNMNRELVCIFPLFFFMSFLVKQFVYIHNEIKRLKHAL